MDRLTFERDNLGRMIACRETETGRKDDMVDDTAALDMLIEWMDSTAPAPISQALKHGKSDNLRAVE